MIHLTWGKKSHPARQSHLSDFVLLTQWDNLILNLPFIPPVNDGSFYPPYGCKDSISFLKIGPGLKGSFFNFS